MKQYRNKILTKKQYRYKILTNETISKQDINK